MLNRLGVYEFFSYTIPGAIYLIVGLWILSFTGIIEYSLRLMELDLVQLTVAGLASYLIGLLFDPVAKSALKLVNRKNGREIALEIFKSKHESVDIDFRSNQWALLLAFVRRDNADIAQVYERLFATHLMLRNTSFAFLILAVAGLVKSVVSLSWWPELLIILAGLLAFFVAARQSHKYTIWSTMFLFESYIAIKDDEKA